ncbi:hypothetical protein RJT34_13254 [Clitoria ternatea]|uniref:Uncharacterized protein n=1 Tax=Clitoria ternatea TaxID=43366 RepID=A0AAN9JQ92_CLITE
MYNNGVVLHPTIVQVAAHDNTTRNNLKTPVVSSQFPWRRRRRRRPLHSITEALVESFSTLTLSIVSWFQLRNWKTSKTTP